MNDSRHCFEHGEQILSVGRREIDCVISLAKYDFEVVAFHRLKHFPQLITNSIGVLKHRAMVWAQCEVVLVVEFEKLVFTEERDRLKVVRPVVELEWQLVFADLADRLP